MLPVGIEGSSVPALVSVESTVTMRMMTASKAKRDRYAPSEKGYSVQSYGGLLCYHFRLKESATK